METGLLFRLPIHGVCSKDSFRHTLNVDAIGVAGIGSRCPFARQRGKDLKWAVIDGEGGPS